MLILKWIPFLWYPDEIIKIPLFCYYCWNNNLIKSRSRYFGVLLRWLWFPLISFINLSSKFCCLPLDNGMTSSDWKTEVPEVLFTLQSFSGSQAMSEISSTCLASSSYLSCSPHSLTGFSWELIPNTWHTHKSLCVVSGRMQIMTENHHESQNHWRKILPDSNKEICPWYPTCICVHIAH